MAGGGQQSPSAQGEDTVKVAPGERAFDFGNFGKGQSDQFSRAAAYENPTGYGQNTLAQYLANLPAYQQPGGSQQARPNTLDADTAAYQKSTTDALAAERARMIAANNAAMNAYQTARGNADLRAEYQGQINALNSQLSSLLAEQKTWQDSGGGSSNYNEGNYNWGASGGLASLQGFDK